MTKSGPESPEWYEERIERRGPQGANLRRARAELFEGLRALRHVKLVGGEPNDCYVWLLAQIWFAYQLTEEDREPPRCVLHGRPHNRCQSIRRALAELKKLEETFPAEHDALRSIVNRLRALRIRLTRWDVNPSIAELQSFCDESDVALPRKPGRPENDLLNFVLESCHAAFEGTKLSQKKCCDWACDILRFCFGYWPKGFRAGKFDDLVRRWQREKARVRKRGPSAIGLGWPDAILLPDGAVLRRR
jgi:hypothetical protein